MGCRPLLAWVVHNRPLNAWATLVLTCFAMGNAVSAFFAVAPAARGARRARARTILADRARAFGDVMRRGQRRCHGQAQPRTISSSGMLGTLFWQPPAREHKAHG
jgi:hypothetical protein